MSHSLAARIYTEQLRMHGHGEPLWQPEPPKDGEVLIGDVGFIEDGRFYRLFSATLPADHPINAASGVPDGFKPLEYNGRVLSQTNDNYLGPKPIYSKSVAQFKVGAGTGAKGLYASYKFTCKSEKGAVLVPGDDVTLSHVQRNKHFLDYIRLNHDSWHEFALAQGRIIEAEEIILVTGFLKTSEWALAALMNHGKAHAVSFSAQASPVAQAEFTLEMSEDVETSVSQRSGPKRDDCDSATRLRDQCLFMKYYKAKRNRFLGKKITANAEPQDDRDDKDEPHSSHNRGPSSDSTDRSSDSLTVEEVPSGVTLNDPLDDVLNYILFHSTAKIAVASHDDVYDLWQNTTDWPDDFYTHIKDILPDIRVDENNVGCMSKQELDRKGKARTSYQTPPTQTRPLNVTPIPGRSNPTTRRRRNSEQPSKANTQALLPSGRPRRAFKTFSFFTPKDQKTTKIPKPDVNDSLVYHVSLDVQPPSGSSAESTSSLTSEIYELPRKAKQPRQSFSNKSSEPREHSVSPLLPHTSLPLMHWQLLAPNPLIAKRIYFDMAFPVRHILKYVDGNAVQIGPRDLAKSAVSGVQLNTMTIRCTALHHWDIAVENANGVTCGDVFEAIYNAMNTQLSHNELELYVPEKEGMDVEDDFSRRCQDIAASGISTQREGRKRIDLLQGRRIFAGLKLSRGEKMDTWELNVTDEPSG